MCAILKKHGFEQVRQRRSHIIIQKQGDGTTISVPVTDHKELRVGALRSINRQSGLDRSSVTEHRRKHKSSPPSLCGAFQEGGAPLGLWFSAREFRTVCAT
jgi:predicted RNA binding protein YcfA (HicA-like mRNA interferase family)